ncbi:MAG TPA: SRPBCC domain-containing protein [Solirubrobacterales bacterium]|nr:SRPBCC domain-containing protein [Solirubrobacterales bacterium]
MSADADSADVPTEGDGERSGDLQVGRSKQVVAPAARAFAAFEDAELRRQWLGDEAPLEIRDTVPERSLAIAWPDGATIVTVNLYPKGRAKCVVQVIHEGLPDAAAVERMTAYWGERLERLRQLLEEGA